MAIVVVGGGSHDAGKTTLVCALLAALPEFDWIAVKVTTHEHGGVEPVHEEKAGDAQVEARGTDSARYLAAGARRAFLLTADESELALRLKELFDLVGRGSHFLFESNRIVNHVEPNLCIAIGGDEEAERKASFAALARRMDALVVRADRDGFVPGARPVFELASFEHLSAPLREWVGARLQGAFPAQAELQ